MTKVRVYELAKKLGLTSKEVLAALNDMGEFVRTASSTIEAPVVRRLSEKLREGSAKKEQPEPKKPAPRVETPKAAAPAPEAPKPTAPSRRPPGPLPQAAAPKPPVPQPPAPAARCRTPVPTPNRSRPIPQPPRRASDPGPEASLGLPRPDPAVRAFRARACVPPACRVRATTPMRPARDGRPRPCPDAQGGRGDRGAPRPGQTGGLPTGPRPGGTGGLPGMPRPNPAMMPRQQSSQLRPGASGSASGREPGRGRTRRRWASRIRWWSRSSGGPGSRARPWAVAAVAAVAAWLRHPGCLRTRWRWQAQP